MYKIIKLPKHSRDKLLDELLISITKLYSMHNCASLLDIDKDIYVINTYIGILIRQEDTCLLTAGHA